MLKEYENYIIFGGLLTTKLWDRMIITDGRGFEEGWETIIRVRSYIRWRLKVMVVWMHRYSEGRQILH